jgi:oxygen-independent coproporphyrinogen-3 oxidase
MSELRRIIETAGGIDVDIEWTAEANPESISQTLSRDWLAAGVNRISLGVQTFHAPALRWMGRLHGADGARAALETVRAAGFDNVNIDLIFGLPDKLGRDWEVDLEHALALQPDHISLYGLTAESGAALGRWVTEGRAVLPQEETYATEYLTAARVLSAAGYDHYEVSNFARPGRESRHNQAYWKGAAYLGLGPGAHSYRPPERFWNVRSWKEYRDCLRRGELPRDNRESLEPAAAMLERIWLGLRTRIGAVLPERTARIEKTLRQWQSAGWAELDGDSIRLTPDGWLLLDRLAVELDAAVAA